MYCRYGQCFHLHNTHWHRFNRAEHICLWTGTHWNEHKWCLCYQCCRDCNHRECSLYDCRGYYSCNTERSIQTSTSQKWWKLWLHHLWLTTYSDRRPETFTVVMYPYSRLNLCTCMVSVCCTKNSSQVYINLSTWHHCMCVPCWNYHQLSNGTACCAHKRLKVSEFGLRISGRTPLSTEERGSCTYSPQILVRTSIYA